MAVFECKPIRQHVGNKLLASGAEWSEETSVLTFERKFVVGLLAVFGTIGAVLFIPLLSGELALLGAIGICGFGVPAVFGARYLFRTPPRRSVVFLSDGTVTVPKGLPLDSSARTLSLQQHDIAAAEIGGSVSGMPTDDTSSVRLTTRNGETIHVAQLLHVEHAQKIAVQLNLALREIREAVNQQNVMRAGTSEKSSTSPFSGTVG